MLKRCQLIVTVTPLHAYTHTYTDTQIHIRVTLLFLFSPRLSFYYLVLAFHPTSFSFFYDCPFTKGTHPQHTTVRPVCQRGSTTRHSLFFPSYCTPSLSFCRSLSILAQQERRRFHLATVIAEVCAKKKTSITVESYTYIQICIQGREGCPSGRMEEVPRKQEKKKGVAYV